MEDHLVLYTDIPVNKPHPEEPKQQMEPKVSSESTTVIKPRSLTDHEITDLQWQNLSTSEI